MVSQPDLGNTFSSDSEPEINQMHISEDIRNWALQFNITLSALTSLLKLLSPIIPNLPRDARTLLMTPAQVNTSILAGGEYWHAGLQKMLETIASKQPQIPQILKLNFFFDGLSVSGSSKGQFWPIMFNIQDVCIKPFIIGIFYGQSKPKSCSEYLR